MSDSSDFHQLREESLQRLKELSTRSSYRPNWKEKMINSFPFPKSSLYLMFMRFCGMKVGRNVQTLGRIKVKIRGDFANISIGNDVVLGKNVDLRNRENGKIQIEDRVYLDDNVRIVAAREGTVHIKLGAELGANTIINSGGNTTIGRYVLCAGFININSSSHGIEKERFVKDQAHIHGKVSIGDDVWIGAYSAVLMNSSIGNGAIVGSHSVVRGEIPDFGICVGVPAKVIKSRS